MAPTEAQAPTTISFKAKTSLVGPNDTLSLSGLGKRFRPLSTTIRRAAGFTLMEIMIVMAIIAMVIALGLPSIQRVTNQRINSSTRKFVGLIRTVRNDAVLLNGIYRLAIDLENKTYWIEVQKEARLLLETAEAPKSKQKGKSAPPPSNFQIATKYSKEPMPMPGGVAFEGVLKERDGLIKEGIAYVHFFPNGFNEQAILYLKKDGSKTISYSLLIRPTSGKVDIYPEMVSGFDGGPLK
jgi:prepilin-type N-terminal cleavage/methylation domain-containing protein